MWRKLFTYFTLFALIANLVAYQYTYVYFKVNQKYIAQTLCVKKDVKNNSCQGKCHLKKLIKNTQSSTEKAWHELSSDFICESLPYTPMAKAFYIQTASPSILSYITPVHKGYLSGIYTPPDFI